jgi:hypothetical protein
MHFFNTKFKFSTISSLVYEESQISWLRKFGGEDSNNIGFEVNADVIGCVKILTYNVKF